MLQQGPMARRGVSHINKRSYLAEMKSLLAGFSAERPTEEVYDENYDFLPELVEEAYAQAFETVMADPESCCEEETLDVQLTYSMKGWMIQGNETLMNAICGK